MPASGILFHLTIDPFSFFSFSYNCKADEMNVTAIYTPLNWFGIASSG